MIRVNNKYIQLGLCTFALATASCSRNEAEPSGEEKGVANESSKQIEAKQTNLMKNGKTIDQQVSAAVADLAVRSKVEANNITNESTEA